jgi:hypothetical protein
VLNLRYTNFRLTYLYSYTSALLWFFYICFTLFTPLLIQQLIVAVNVPLQPSDPQGAAIWLAVVKGMTGGIPLFTHIEYALALSLFGCKIFQTLAGRSADQLIRRVALNTKTALVGAVYRKSLRIGVQGLGRFEKVCHAIPLAINCCAEYSTSRVIF